MEKILSITFYSDANKLKTDMKFHRIEEGSSIIYQYEVISISESMLEAIKRLNRNTLSKSVKDSMK